MKNLTLTICLFLSFVTAPSLAQDDPHEADREAMLVILKNIEQALNDRDLTAALKNMDGEVIITYQDSTVTQGPEEAAAYYKKMMEGAAAIVNEFSTVATVGAPAVFHGDTAIAHGTTVDRYVLARGLELTLNANWSTTLQKRDGEWVVLALHFSTDLFDNPMLNSSRRMTKIAGVGGLLAGLLLMWIIGRVRRKSAAA